MDAFVWLAVALCVGAAARIVLPGRDPIGLAGTLILGVVGSVIGGLVGTVLIRGDRTFAPAGLIGSILGALVALMAYRVAASRRPV